MDKETRTLLRLYELFEQSDENDFELYAQNKIENLRNYKSHRGSKHYNILHKEVTTSINILEKLIKKIP